MKGANAALVLLLAGAAMCGAQSTADGGGRDVSVAMFSLRHVTQVTISAAGAGAWVSRCAGCAREPLAAPVVVRAPGEWTAGGPVRVRDDGSGDERVATGLWRLRWSGGATDVVLTLSSERYVAAVLTAEVGANEPAESMRAMAVLVRTYALNGRHFSSPAGRLEADVCDSTQCQAMRLGGVPAAVEEAVQATAGETLWWKSRRAEVFFSQNCGGVTEDAGAVWPRLHGVEYLRSHADAYCVREGAMQWHAEVSLGEFGGVARAEGWKLPSEVVAVRVSERTASHRAGTLVFVGRDGREAALSASALRFGIGRALGWNRVASDAYDVAVRGGKLVFDGRGRGHGVGLCQAGATEMAREGKSAREILGFYFPGTTQGIGPAGDGGWVETRMGPVRVRSVGPVSGERKEVLARAWNSAQKRYVVRKSAPVEVVFAPSTEMFRQLAEQPGWMLASTRGNVVVLQPEQVLARRGGGVEQVLLHEMLHVLVESEARPETPLWLREGLVEVLAGESRKGAMGMSPAATESALRSAGSWNAEVRAHEAAGSRVQALVDRYGMAVVRGWLGSGVPAGVVAR